MRSEKEFMKEAKHVGDRVTADTIVLKSLKDRGVNRESNAIVFFDLATGWIDCIPVKSRHTDMTVKAMRPLRQECLGRMGLLRTRSRR